MRITFFGIAAMAAILFSACNNGDNKNEHENHGVNNDTAQHDINKDDKEVKAVAVIYANADAKVAASIKEIVDHYLQIKNGLANDNSKEAAYGGDAMTETMKKMDKSLLTAEQKKVYDEIEDNLKEHAEHIDDNSGNIKHQRQHFAMMSEDVYDLVKAFGAGQPIYHDHCPMYNENKGAMWLSEMKEIKNPYFGSEMPECGSVEEVIK